MKQNSLKDSFKQNSLNEHHLKQNCLNTELFSEDTESDIIENVRKPFNIKTVVFVIAIFLMIIFICFYRMTHVKVPNLYGMSEIEANRILKDRDLKMKINIQYIKSEVEESVIEQSKEANENVKKGSVIEVTIQKEQKFYNIGDLTGKSYESINNQLQNRNILVTKKEEYASNYKKGIIKRQSVSAGTKLYSGESITLVVSKGHEKTTVPNVAGLSKSKAKKKLEIAKLNVNTDYEYNNSVSEGNVIRQSISSGKRVNTNKKVTIIVSRGKKPIPRSTSKPKPSTQRTPSTHRPTTEYWHIE